MKIFLLVAAAGLMTTLNIHNAAAFSTDQRDTVNTDGSAKYTDPDEQLPNFMVGPDSGSAGNRVISGSESRVTLPATGENDSGARAFDQAFSHQEDKQ